MEARRARIIDLADRLTEAGVEQMKANAIARAVQDAQGEPVRREADNPRR